MPTKVYVLTFYGSEPFRNTIELSHREPPYNTGGLRRTRPYADENAVKQEFERWSQKALPKTISAGSLASKNGISIEVRLTTNEAEELGWIP
jgi:hypothetical protein